MAKIDSLSNLSQRANINIKSTTNADVVIYEDHRTILNVLYFLKTQQQLEFPFDLILFDNHDDGCTPSETALNKINKFNQSSPSLQEFWSFTEFDLNGLDDDWIKAGMELNLINNVFLFNATETNINFLEHYETKCFGTKKYYNLGTLWNALSFRGCLYDAVKFDQYGELWEDFGWVYNREDGRFDFAQDRQFLLDFDLDCFSMSILDKRVAIPKGLLIEKFKAQHIHQNHYYYSWENFVRELIERSVITTICFENVFCGGYRETFKIFETIDYLFFDNQLGK